jgi:hypothetical protein
MKLDRWFELVVLPPLLSIGKTEALRMAVCLEGGPFVIASRTMLFCGTLIFNRARNPLGWRWWQWVWCVELLAAPGMRG